MPSQDTTNKVAASASDDEDNGGPGNSVDDFINNGYSSDEMRDDDYMSDSSLKQFLRQLKNDGVFPETQSLTQSSQDPTTYAAKPNEVLTFFQPTSIEEPVTDKQ